MAGENPGVGAVGGSRLSGGVGGPSWLLIHNEAPKSLNRGGAGSRGHWSKGHKEKQMWEGIYTMLLLLGRVPRPAVRVHVDATLLFKDNRRRDVENYRPAISKPLADALVKGGWLADDTDEFFDFGYVKIVSGWEPPSPLVKSGIEIELTPDYA